MDFAKTYPHVTGWAGLFVVSQIGPAFLSGILTVSVGETSLPRIPIPLFLLTVLFVEAAGLVWWTVNHSRACVAAGKPEPSLNQLFGPNGAKLWRRWQGAKWVQRRHLREVNRQWPKWARSHGFVFEVPLTKQKVAPPLHRKTLKFDANNDLPACFVNAGRYTLTLEPLETKAVSLAAAVNDCIEVTTKRGPNNSIGKGTVGFYWSNPLGRVTTLADLPERTDPMMISYGERRDGSPAQVRKDRSILIGGMTGQGKSNLVWILLASLLAEGEWVNLYVADNKGGIELPALERMAGILKAGPKASKDHSDPVFDKQGVQMDRLKIVAYVSDEDGSDTVELLLPKAVKDMKVRRSWQRKSGQRKLTESSEANPLCVVIVDEITLIDEELKKKTRGNLGKILTGGRASLFVAWLCTQDARVDTIPSALRSLVPYRVGFKTDGVESTNAIFGTGAATRGALSHMLHDIDDRGLCFSGAEGVSGFAKARTPMVTDADIEFLSHGKVPPAMLERGQVKETSTLAPAGTVYFGCCDQPEWRARYGMREPYIGMTMRPWTDRVGEHERDDWGWCDLCRQEENWWLKHVTRVETVTVDGGEKAVLDAEYKAIRRYRPVFNKQHNGDADTWRRRMTARLVVGAPRVRTLKVEALDDPHLDDGNEPLFVPDLDEPVHVDGVWSE